MGSGVSQDNAENRIYKILGDQILAAGSRIEAASYINMIPISIVSLVAIGFVAVILINYILTLIKLYFVLNIGVLAVALGGCSINNSYTMNYLKECFSYALQILALIMIISTIETYYTNFIGVQGSESSLLTTILFAVVTAIFAVLFQSVPQAVASLVGGSASGGISPISAGKTAAVATAGAECNAPHREFHKRVAKGRSPLPSLSSCMDNQTASNSTLSSKEGIAAFIPKHKVQDQCIEYKTTYTSTGPKHVCAEYNYKWIEDSYIRAAVCIHGERGTTTPKGCTKTVKWVEVLDNNEKVGSTYYW